MKRGARGLTLIEVMVSLAIFTVFALAIMSVFRHTMNAGADNSKENELAGRGRQTLDRIRKEIAFGRIVECPGDPAINYAYLGYRVPLNSTPDYGYYNLAGVGQVDWTARLAIIPDRILREQNTAAMNVGLPERIMPLNINRDTDTTDRFAVCRLVLQVRDAGNVLQYTTGIDDYLMLMPTSASGVTPMILGGDINNDGSLDPVFRLLGSAGNELTSSAPATLIDGRQVRVVLFHGGEDSSGRIYFLRRNEDRIRLEQRQ